MDDPCPISPAEASLRAISQVKFGPNTFKVSAKAGVNSYYLKLKRGFDLLILSDYGRGDWQGSLPSELEELVWFLNTEKGWTLTIRKQTGQLYIAYFYEDQGEIEIQVDPLTLQRYSVPISLLGKLDTLLGQKRPFDLGLEESFALNLTTGWEGKKDIGENLTIKLGISPVGSRGYIEIGPGSWRWASSWQDIPAKSSSRR